MCAHTHAHLCAHACTLRHVHTRAHARAHFVAQVQATGWKEDLLQLTTVLLFIMPFSAQAFNRGVEVGGIGRSWNVRPWLLWVKPPTHCSWKGWCAGWAFYLDLNQLSLAAPTRVHLPRSLASSYRQS